MDPEILVDVLERVAHVRARLQRLSSILPYLQNSRLSFVDLEAGFFAQAVELGKEGVKLELTVHDCDDIVCQSQGRTNFVQFTEHGIDHNGKTERAANSTLHHAYVGDHFAVLGAESHLVTEFSEGLDHSAVVLSVNHDLDQLSAVHRIEGFLEVNEDKVRFRPLFEGHFGPYLGLDLALRLPDEID